MSFLPVSAGGRRYGRFRDNPNHPARTLRLFQADPAVVLPSKADVWRFKGPTRDQGQEGSCTGQMGAELRDALYRQFFTSEVNQSVPADRFEASAEFIYLCNLIADGNLGADAGSSIHQTFISLNQKGACLNSQMPYSDSQYSTPPTAEQFADGLVYKGGAYHYIPDLATMKSVIASGYSFGFGISVYQSFESDWAQPGMMPVPDITTEQLLGGHAQHVMAYDDTLVFPDSSVGGLGVQNSWGSGWGISAPGHSDGGCYWMSYKFVELNDPNNGPAVSDAWVMHLGAPWVPKQ